MNKLKSKTPKPKEEVKYKPLNQSIEKSTFRFLKEETWFDILSYLNVVSVFKLEQVS